MALWARVKRVFRSFVGWFVEWGEDPELILKQNIRDLEDQIPSLNEHIATIKANETLERREVEKLAKQETSLAGKIKAALKQGNRDLALKFATELDKIRQNKAEAESRLGQAKLAYDKALKVKRAFLQEKERKVSEARTALNAKKKAEWQSKVAEAMTSFSVTGVDATHDEMIRKIEENAAQSEAKLEIALETVEVQHVDLDAEAQKIAAQDTLRQFELEMGMHNSVPADMKEEPQREKTIGPRERELA